MSTKSQCTTAAIIISSIILSACSDVEGDKETTSVTLETNFNDSSLIEETTTDYNIGPGNTIRNSEGKIIDPMNDKVVEPESTSEENILD